MIVVNNYYYIYIYMNIINILDNINLIYKRKQLLTSIIDELNIDTEEQQKEQQKEQEINNKLENIKSVQKKYIEDVLEQLTYKKTDHWIWYIFPQICGFGSSAQDKKYCINLPGLGFWLSSSYFIGRLLAWKIGPINWE